MNHQFLRSLLYCNITGFLFWMLLMMGAMLFRKKGGHRNAKPGGTLLLLIILYFSSIIAITVIPLPFSTYRRASDSDLNFIPVIRSVKIFLYPFKHNRMALLPDILENLIGNVLMFMPFGLLLPMAHKWFRKWYRLLFAAILFSSVIEATQWVWRHFGNYRHVDIDDVILNTTGAIIGYCLFLIQQKIREIFTSPGRATASVPIGA